MGDSALDAIVWQIGSERRLCRRTTCDLQLECIIPTFNEAVVRIELKVPIFTVVMFLNPRARPACPVAFTRFAIIEDEPGAFWERRPGERLVLLIEDRNRQLPRLARLLEQIANRIRQFRITIRCY